MVITSGGQRAQLSQTHVHEDEDEEGKKGVTPLSPTYSTTNRDVNTPNISSEERERWGEEGGTEAEPVRVRPWVIFDDQILKSSIISQLLKNRVSNIRSNQIEH